VTPRLSLALAIHNHQPVGNFGWIYEEAFRQAYLPFVGALEDHPGVRLALHYSGPLLEWLGREQPAFLDRVVALVGRGQVELMGGGWDEPILVALPERDRIGQLARMSDELERVTGRRPTGAWLAERVWEPSLPSSLADAGYRWTIVDDVHFRAASVPPEAAWGAYSTDDQGRRIDVFATDQKLRYAIPFAEPEAVLEYLGSVASPEEPRLATMGDDGEKFGSWPRTYEHCWGSGRWVDRFFEALEEAAEWLTMTTPSEWLIQHVALGRAYIPTASYIEMTEWALPPDESIAFGEALRRAVEAGAPEARWLRGGFWRTFQARYREINDMHKAMLRASAKVAAMAPGKARDRARDHLYQGQSNDTYWHGVFGGVYINHLRVATWEHLIAAEDLADGPAHDATAVLVDVDLDGQDEALLESPAQLAVIDLAEGGGIGEWDLRAVRHNLTAVLRRRPEASHIRLLEGVRVAAQRLAAEEERLAAEDGPAQDGAPKNAAAEDGDENGDAPRDEHVATIHDHVMANEEGLAGRIAYDRHERRSGLVHLLDVATTHEDFANAAYEEQGDFVDQPFEVLALAPGLLRVRRDGAFYGGGAPQAVRIEKTLSLAGDRAAPSARLEVTVTNRSPQPIATVLAVDWALNLLGGGGNPQAYYRVRGERMTHDGIGADDAPGVVSFGNDWIGLEVDAVAEPNAAVWWQPIETISNSEGGSERVYQGSSLLFRWPVDLAPGASMTARMRLDARCARDRTAEELAGAVRDVVEDAGSEELVGGGTAAHRGR
jgi:hypothetical protein